MNLKKLSIPALVLVTSFATVAQASPKYEREEPSNPNNINGNMNSNTNNNMNHANSNAHANSNLNANLSSNSAAISRSGALSGSASNASTGAIDINNASSTSLQTGATTQNVGDNTQTVGDTSQTTNTASTGNTTSVGGQNVNYSNNTQVGAITGAPNLGSQYVIGECKDGWGFSIGGGSPFTGSAGIGIQKTEKDDTCIREGREHQKTLKAMAITHAEKVANITTTSNETVARINGATNVAVTGMKHLCNLAAQKSIPATQSIRPEHGACENYTSQAVDFLFPQATKKAKAPVHKH